MKKQAGLGAAALLILAGASCQALLKDDYTHPCAGVPADEACPGAAGASGSGGGGTGGGATGCTTAGDCPGGPHGKATCHAGTCGFDCDKGFANCTGEPGCETPTDADTKNCGACGTTCSAFCVKGECNDPVAIAAGSNNVFAILKDGSLWGWGDNEWYTLANDTMQFSSIPVQIDVGQPVLDVAVNGAGGNIYPGPLYSAHACAVLADHTMSCWGGNASGQLGVGDTTYRTAPAQVPLANVSHVGVGGWHTCSILSDGSLWCWGSNSHGQVGSNSFGDVLAPVQVAVGASMVSLGAYHGCSVDENGDASCWGNNKEGEVGDGTTVDVRTPVVVLGGGLGAVALATGATHTCFTASLGTWCWGTNSSGELGIGSTVASPIPALLGLPDAQALFAGSGSTASVTKNGAFVWGSNIGDNTTATQESPSAAPLAGVVSFALGQGFSCALESKHAVYCWGDNTYGTLGNGKNGIADASLVPVPVVWPQP